MVHAIGQILLSSVIGTGNPCAALRNSEHKAALLRAYVPMLMVYVLARGRRTFRIDMIRLVARLNERRFADECDKGAVHRGVLFTALTALTGRLIDFLPKQIYLLSCPLSPLQGL